MPATLLPAGLLLLCCCAGLSESRTWYVSVNATSGGDGTQGNPFQRISSGAAVAMPGDTVLVAGGVYRERVAPARSGTEHAPITYMAAPGQTVVITAAEALQWVPSPIQGGSFVAQLNDSLFDTLDGTPAGQLYNPFLDPMQPNSGCNAIHTGQVYVDGAPLTEIDLPDLHKCGTSQYHPPACFSVNTTAKTLHARWPKQYNGTVPPSVEVTVRSRVFAPHKRGLQYIVVQGFTIEKAANQWIANFWFPQNYHYAQSGALGTRSGYRWTVRNNTIRYAKTIGFDWGIEGGYAGHPVDNEGTNQSDPAMHGDHTVENNIFERNEVSGVQGYGATGNFGYNLIQDNGGLGCAGAENAAFKSHGYNGTFEGNVFRRNSVGLPIWFDAEGGAVHFTRNVILVDELQDSSALVFELGAGPVVADNNILVGPGGGHKFTSAGVAAQDHSGANLGHNLVVEFNGAAVSLGGLTGRSNSAMKDWWLGGNMLLTSGKGAWLHIHKRKVFAGREAIQNETAQHNLVTGGEPDFPPNQPGNLNITVGPNQNAVGSSFAVDVDRDGMTLSIQGDAVLDKTACQAGGPGGDRDFTGAKRTGPKCVPGPLRGLVAGQRFNVSLWPEGGSWP